MDSTSSRPNFLRRRSSSVKLSPSSIKLALAPSRTPLPLPSPSALDQHLSALQIDLHPSTASQTALPTPDYSFPTRASPPRPSMSIASSASTPHLPLLSSNASFTSTSTGTTTSNVGSIPNLPSASLSSTLEMLRSLVGKRITAWTYLKNAGEGKVYWFNTVLLTTDDMRTAFTNEKMRTRTIRFAVLGMSLSSLLDISPAHDFLRSLLSLVQEFEAVPEERFGGRHPQRSLFKVGSRSRRGGGLSAAAAASGGADFSMGLPGEGGEASYLLTANIPFELDYFQVLITTCEMLVDIYTKISSYLGPSPSSSSSPGSFPQPPGARTSVAAPLPPSVSGGALSQSLAEVVYKVDTRLKKLISMLSKEIDTLARAAIKAELNNLGGGDFGLDGLDFS